MSGMMIMARRIWGLEIVRFGLTGLINTAFYYLVFSFLVWTGAIQHNVCQVIATVIGVLFNFFTTGQLVFRKYRVLPTAFFCVYLVQTTANALGLNALKSAGMSPYLAQLLLLPLLAIFTFFALKHFAYRPLPKAAPAQQSPLS